MPPLRGSDTDTATQLLLLNEKLDAFIKRMDDAIAEGRKKDDDHEERLRELETKVIPSIQRVESDLSARLAMTQILQGSYATIVGAVAAILGYVQH